MRIDILTIFPNFFTALDESLIGKARTREILDIAVHDLRDWTTDRHRTVDDTPYGGGAGMVMRPDVWGRALDDIAAVHTGPEAGASPLDANPQSSPRQPLIAIPTPTGEVLTQAKAEELAGREHIIFACGRYEGIDSRVAQHYGAQVWEFSIGDYVLNGGEVATLVAIEAIGRLVDGMVGNPGSLTEESHSAAGLLEYDIFTKPQQWRGLEVPPVLRSGDHARIERFRRTQALVKTATRRPDMIADLDWEELDSTDREVLAARGFSSLGPVTYHTEADAAELSRLARAILPLAFPDDYPKDAIERFGEEALSVEKFAQFMACPDHHLVVARSQDQLIGYALIIDPPAADYPLDLVDQGRLAAGSPYLSKLYLDAAAHGTGIGGALIEIAIAQARTRLGAITAVGLNTSRYDNRGVIKFYRRHGFRRCGPARQMMGGVESNDILMVREITDQEPPLGDLAAVIANLDVAQ